MKAFYLCFAKALYDTAERYQELPNKFIDTRFIILVNVIICLLIGVTNLHLQRLVIDTCVTPVIPTPPSAK
jgi:hypothetical protein